jgi:glutathionylspermidine synthase
MIYVPDVIVREAREKGLTNFSKFVREKLIEFNADAPTTTSNASATNRKEGD